MASPNSVFTELVATTLRAHPNEMADNVSNHNALYRRLKDRNKIKKISGGYEIVRPLDYAENSTYQRFSGYDVLNVQASDVLSAAKYDWVQAAVHVSASGDELRKNNGKEKLIDLVKSRVTNAMRTAANNMSVDLYSSGALSNQVGGLAHIIQNDGGGTVGGIDSTSFTFWKNQFKESANIDVTDGVSDAEKALIRKEMNDLWLQCTRGTDKPDLIVSTHDFYSAYWESIVDHQRYNSDSGSANQGFNALKFNEADIIFDSNDNFTTSGEKMYFLNTNYLELVCHSEANWTQMENKTPVNQDAVVIPLIWQGNLTCSNRDLQGVYIDAA